MAISTFDGPVRSLGGMYNQGPNSIVTLGATATLTVADHAGKILLVPATCAITLPTIISTAYPASSGPGGDPNSTNNLSVRFTLLYTAASAGATAQTVTAGGSDVYVGMLLVKGTTTAGFSSTTNTIITLNATTTGGAAAGSYINLIPYASAKWFVEGALIGSGSVATPFS
jgi:hypothetical protein